MLALLTVVSSLFLDFNSELFAHLFRYVLPEAVFNSIRLTLGVCLLANIIAVPLAWLTAVCEFPLRRFFAWALFLPMAIPGYVMAFAFVGIFEYTGFVQTFIRKSGVSAEWFPEVYSYGGVVLVLALVLYPYIYMLARSAFVTQGVRSLEVGQSLGLSTWRSFYKVSLPMARPWIAAGSLLVMMETLADFGTVAIFNFNTLTSAIYKSWFDLYSIPAALQISTVLLLIVALVVGLERRSRKTMRYEQGIDQKLDSNRIVLVSWYRWGAFIACAFIFLLAFVLPLYQLILWAWPNLIEELTLRFWDYLFGSITVATMAMCVVVIVAILLAFIARNSDTQSYAAQEKKNRFLHAAIRISTLGYALPGTVLAIGLFVPITRFSNWLSEMGLSNSLLEGTLLVMLLAYTVRFLAVAYSPIETNFLRITPSIDMAAKSLGVSGLRLFRRVHLPLLAPGVLTALVLVFVDVIKELPITLMTRPFGLNTLAVRIFELTSEGLWERAALPALTIILIGLIPVIILIRRMTVDSDKGLIDEK